VSTIVTMVLYVLLSGKGPIMSHDMISHGPSAIGRGFNWSFPGPTFGLTF
jgi:hypothetical protein